MFFYTNIKILCFRKPFDRFQIQIIQTVFVVGQGQEDWNFWHKFVMNLSQLKCRIFGNFMEKIEIEKKACKSPSIRVNLSRML